jgi:hypothetical protein
MEKIDLVKQKIVLAKADVFVVTALDEVACNKSYYNNLIRALIIRSI